MSSISSRPAWFYEVHRRLTFPNLLMVAVVLPMVFFGSPFMSTGELLTPPLLIGLMAWWLGATLTGAGVERDANRERVYLASRGVGRSRSLAMRWLITLAVGALLIGLWIVVSQHRIQVQDRTVMLDAATVEWLQRHGHAPEVVDDGSRNRFEHWRGIGSPRKERWPVEVRLPHLGIVPWMFAMLFFALGVVGNSEPRKLSSLGGPVGGVILMAACYFVLWAAHRLGLPSLSEWMMVAASLWPRLAVLVGLVTTMLIGARMLQTRQREDLS